MDSNEHITVILLDPQSPLDLKIADDLASIERYSLVGASRYQRAETALEEHTGAVIVLINLRDDGRSEGLKNGKRLLEHYNVPLLFITDASDQHRIEQIRDTVPYGYIIRGCDRYMLQQAIDSAMKLHKSSREARQERKKLKTIFENIPFEFWVCDQDGRYIMQNPKSIEYWGNQVGKKAEELNLSKDLKQKIIKSNKRVLSGELIKEEVTQTENGTSRIYQKIQTPIIIEGEITGYIGINIDITDQKVVENELNTLATTFSAKTGDELFDNVCRHLVEVLNMDYAFIGELIDENRIKVRSMFSSDGAEEPFTYDLKGTPCANVAGQQACHYASNARNLFPDDKMLDEFKIEGYIGIPLFSSSEDPMGIAVLMSKRPIEDPERCQKLLQVYSDRVSSEIERIQAEEILKEREKQLASINRHITEGIYRSTPNDGLVYVNQAFADMFGYDEPEEILSIDGPDLYVDPQRRRELERLENEQGFIKNEEIEFKRKDGSTFWALMSGTVVHDENGNVRYYDGSILDITERKKAIEENRRLLEAIQQSPVSIVITDTEGSIEYVNPQFERQTGFSKEEILGTTANIMKKGDPVVNKKGKELWKTIRQGNEWRGIFQNQTKDKRSFWEEVTISPIIDNEGRIINYIAVCEDITKRKEHQEQLEQSIAEKEVLLAEIHHRVKNNLAVVSGLLELQKYRTGNESIKRVLNDTSSRIQSIANVHELLYKTENFAEIDLQSQLEKLCEGITNSFGKSRQRISYSIDAGGIKLNANQAVPFGLLLNELINNSLKHAFPEKRKGCISIHLDQNDDHITLLYRDDGVGMTDQYFQSPDQKGTLGFTLINTLCEQLQAEKIDYEVEEGFSFKIRFKKVQDGYGGNVIVTEV